MSNQTIETNCCIVGGGPAGMMLGLLLARAGVDVTVLEKHGDFLRDFRGDTIHPSTTEILSDLGMLDDFLALNPQRLPTLSVEFNGQEFVGPDFTALSTKCPFIAMIPQWDFLSLLESHASRHPNFRLRMNTEVVGLTQSSERVSGVVTKTDHGELKVNASLIIAADGRRSIVREASQLPMREFGVPIDVLWFRIGRPESNTAHLLGHIRNDNMMVTIDRGQYIQAGVLIPKGNFDAIRDQGLDAFRERIVGIVPDLRSQVHSIESWDQIKLLTVQINRLDKWHRPGLLCIGDAAHAMSPAGGVGINLAIQDAVATANLLSAKLVAGNVQNDDLQAVQRRRMWPTKVTQRMQVVAHRYLVGGRPRFGLEKVFRLLLWLGRPIIPGLAARMIGIGIRSERVTRND
ncbi:FAD-dependent oxidoreductase [Planctomycetes bacterium K23_9]|uniref:Pentachlorophenol 4-monooxygenase n=1 Tax=Stieleria marina TaxID=1930275 RepID=A0A517NXP3_9BACT|nr:Pentachlorophenol 4-monooxygenase [Planctomycetes bacterium K23_9]